MREEKYFKVWIRKRIREGKRIRKQRKEFIKERISKDL